MQFNIAKIGISNAKMQSQNVVRTIDGTHMKFVVLFEDNPNAEADIRVKLMPDHLHFLERHDGQITAAGPLTETTGVSAGGIWIVDAAGEAEVTALVEEDPFWPAGLRLDVRILLWNQVFADGRALISL